MEAWRQELYHHGVKGQKWGVRKGPPYPLDAEDHTAAEKRAGWKKSLDKPAGSVTKKTKSVHKWNRSKFSRSLTNRPNFMKRQSRLQLNFWRN